MLQIIGETSIFDQLDLSTNIYLSAFSLNNTAHFAPYTTPYGLEGFDILSPDILKYKIGQHTFNIDFSGSKMHRQKSTIDAMEFLEAASNSHGDGGHSKPAEASLKQPP